MSSDIQSESSRLWQPEINTREIHEKSISQLEAECESLLEVDSTKQYTHVYMLRVLASKLRNQCKYQLAIGYYQAAFAKILALAKYQQTHYNLVSQVEIKLDMCLTLFEQGEHQACLEKLSVLQTAIDSVGKASSGDKIRLQRCCLLLMSETKYELKSYDEAKEIVAKVESELTGEEDSAKDRARILTIKANLSSQFKDTEQAIDDYKKAGELYYAALESDKTWGSYRRWVKSQLNYARAITQFGQIDKAVECVNNAIASLTTNWEPENSLRCLLYLEQARLKELEKKYDEAIANLECINEIHQNIIKEQKKRPKNDRLQELDLLVHLLMIKRLATWYVKVKNPVKAGEVYLATAKALDETYPYQQLACLNQALFYFQAIDDSDKPKRLADVLTSIAESNRSLPYPDMIRSLCAIKNAIAIEKDEEREKLLFAIQHEYDDRFGGWPHEWMVQWSWCVSEYSEFKQSWASDSLHGDEFFHWDTVPLVFPPKQRVRLLMLLSRLSCILDQSYFYLVTSVDFKSKADRKLLFPIKQSLSKLQNSWCRFEAHFVKKSEKMDGSSEDIDFFLPIKEAITESQEFSDQASVQEFWLPRLRRISDFSKHVRLGDQRITEEAIDYRSGLLRRKFTDVNIGISRRRGVGLHPLSFFSLFNSTIKSRSTYKALLTAGMVSPIDPADLDLSTLNCGDTRQDFQNKVQEAVSALLSAEETKRLVDFLLILMDQNSESIKNTDEFIQVEPFLVRCFHGIDGFLKLFTRQLRLVLNETEPLIIAVESIADVNSVRAGHFDQLSEDYNKRKKTLSSCHNSPRATLDLYGALHLVASRMLNYFLVHDSVEDVKRLISELTTFFSTIACITQQYQNKIAPWFKIDINFPILPESSILRLDDDLDFRMRSIERNIFLAVPYWMMSPDSVSEVECINAIINAYIETHFVLDQIHMRSIVQARKTFNGPEPFPKKKKQYEKSLVQFIDAKCPLPEKLAQAINPESNSWPVWHGMSCELKHASIKKILNQLSGIRLKEIGLVELDLPSFEKIKDPRLKLLTELKNLFYFMRNIVVEFTQFMQTIPGEPVGDIYQEMENPPEKMERDFSQLATPESALLSQREHFFSTRVDNHPETGGGGAKSEQTALTCESVIEHSQLSYDSTNQSSWIGDGSYGLVCSGTWNKARVAIKHLKVQDLSEIIVRQLQHEAQMMKNMNHPHIIRLFGVCLNPGSLCLVMQLIARGSLSRVLHDATEKLTLSLQLSIAFGIALGLQYLHDQDVLHGDIKSTNVLLDTDNVPMITDFGFSRVKEASRKSLASRNQVPMGTTAWMAPEVISGKSMSKPSDVYSLGVLLWEIAARETPWKGLTRFAIIQRVVTAKECLPKPAGSSPEYQGLVKSCCEHDVTNRPVMRNIVAELEKQLNSTGPDTR